MPTELIVHKTIGAAAADVSLHAAQRLQFAASMRSMITNTAESNRPRHFHRAFAASLFAAPLALAACVTVDEGEDLDEDDAALAVDPAVDEGAPRDGRAIAPAGPVAALPPGCTLYANQPGLVGGTIIGYGGWSGCPATASITVVLRRDIPWWPDKTLDSWTSTGSHGSAELTEPCYFDWWNGIKVFVETQYGSNKVQSVRAVLPCSP